MKCLIEATGWIGDAYFALSLPEKLKKELGYTHVDFVSYRPQPLLLLERNKFIDNVYFNNAPDKSIYDKIFTLPGLADKTIIPTIYFQEFCGIKNTNPEFSIDTIPDFDTLANIFLNTLNKEKPFVAYQKDWAHRRWLFTEEQMYQNKMDTPGNTDFIIKSIRDSNRFNLIEISPYFSNDRDVRGYCNNPNRYAFMASLIKNCDWFLGAEGGMSNLAAGVGTKCIITTCHMTKMFGPNGRMSKHNKIMLGPEMIFQNRGHKNLNPFLNDKQVVQEILNIIK